MWDEYVVKMTHVSMT